MAHDVIMPKTGMAMEEGTIVRWLKKPGDQVAKGEPIAIIETDKVTMDLESEYEGTLLACVHGNGEVVAATKTIAWIGAPGEKVPSAAPVAPVSAVSAPSVAPPAAGVAAPGAASAPASAPAPVSASPGGKTAATPAARRYAAQSGISLARIAGTGPRGSVRIRDVEAALASRSAGSAIPMSGMRRAIAEKMLRSHQQVPAVTLVARVDVTELAAIRARMNAATAGGAATAGATISFTDFIVRAAATALKEHPLINSAIEGDRIIQRAEINIGVAVALEAGLIVPVLHGADTLSLRQISDRTRALAEKARAGSLTPAECAGGTFTVTNLGMYGISEFTPLINVPESAILGVGAIEEALRTGSDGAIQSRRIMSLCLTHDHRHIDGAPAAVFLGRIKALLENCYALLA
jgi:pyruvate dehydrogenase E2 component (dihydrolipoamide acetyltransferase)